jgi:hypothetical protein
MNRKQGLPIIGHVERLHLYALGSEKGSNYTSEDPNMEE